MPGRTFDREKRRVSGGMLEEVTAATADPVYRPAASSEEEPIHTYDAPGIYHVTLTVIDDDGAVGSDSIVVTVAAASDGGGDGWQ